MNPYKNRRTVSAGSVFYIVLFFLVIAALGYLLYYDKGLFWDLLPLVCIPALILALAVTIFYFAKRSPIGYTFILFFLIFLTGLILSAFFGPFALARQARQSYDDKDYSAAIENYETIVDDYSSSRYYDESLVQLAYSHYLDDRFSKALEYFEAASEAGLVSEEDLEIKKIYIDCYTELGDLSYQNGDYRKAADFFIDASTYYRDILVDFPDSNEAFIADYKAPEYLIKAADSLFNVGDFDDCIDISNEVITVYPDSDFVGEAVDLTFDSFIEKAKTSLEKESYDNAIEVFTDILELDNDTIELDGYKFINAKNALFNKVPVYILRDTGYEFYYEEEYKKALFIFEGIAQFRPELKDQFIPYIASSKINLVSDGEFIEIPDSVPVGTINLANKSILSIENNTDFILKFYLRGAEYNIIEVDPSSKQEIEINSGFYQILAELENTDILPFYGKFTYEPGSKYREVFSLEE